MRSIKELVTDLESGLSSPSARELTHCIRIKDRRGAGKILKDEGFDNAEERKAIIDHFTEKWSAKAMKLTPVTKDQVKGFGIKEDGEIGEPFGNGLEFEAPDYLVRIGKTVFISGAAKYFSDKEFMFRDSNFGMYTFEQVDEVLEISFE